MTTIGWLSDSLYPIHRKRVIHTFLLTMFSVSPKAWRNFKSWFFYQTELSTGYISYSGCCYSLLHILFCHSRFYGTQSIAFYISLKASPNMVQFPEHCRLHLCLYLSITYMCMYIDTYERCWLLRDLGFRKKTHATDSSLYWDKEVYELLTLTWLNPWLMYDKSPSEK